jgi:hypothetical protein
MFKVNPTYGDGVGTGKRKGTEETITFTPMETTYKIINSYSIAFLGAFLKGQTDYLTFLTANPWPEELTLKTKGVGSVAGAFSEVAGGSMAGSISHRARDEKLALHEPSVGQDSFGIVHYRPAGAKAADGMREAIRLVRRIRF